MVSDPLEELLREVGELSATAALVHYEVRAHYPGPCRGFRVLDIFAFPRELTADEERLLLSAYECDGHELQMVRAGAPV